jgi:dihydroxy-acid dehydratase
LSRPTCTKAGGARLIAKRLKDAGILKSSAATVTGKTIGEEADAMVEPKDQQVVRPLSNPMSPNGGLAILRGNLAPEGAGRQDCGQKGAHVPRHRARL